MRKGIIAVALSCLIALLGAETASLVNSGLNSWSSPGSDLQDAICDVEWTLPAQPTLQATKQEITERGLPNFRYVLFFSSSYFAISNGIPATIGPDLLTFIQRRTT